MKLFKYNQFIKESVTQFLPDHIKILIEGAKKDYPQDIRNLEILRADLYSEIVETCQSTSYSNLASSNRDPDEDFNQIQSKIEKKGFTLEVIGLLFSDDVNKKIGDFKSFIRKFNLDISNGEVDIYLYKLNEKLNLGTEILLGGEGWASYINNPDTEELGYEVIIKYAYGYHKTNYGQLVLKQSGFNKTEDFVEWTFENLKRNIVSEITDATYRWKKSRIKVEGIDEMLKVDDFESLLNKHFVENDNQLLFMIEGFFDDVHSKVKDIYTDEEFNDICELWKNNFRDLIRSKLNDLSRNVEFKLEVLPEVFMIT
jgi:hypothetical protein